MDNQIIREKNISGFKIQICIGFDVCGSQEFTDLYTESEHIAGTTIKTPSYISRDSDNRHWIGQYSPKELASEYAKQGKKNPSAEAYDSLQKELAHHMTATDYYLMVTISKADIILGESYGISFSHSDYLDCDLEDNAKSMLRDYGTSEMINEACTLARAKLKELLK